MQWWYACANFKGHAEGLHTGYVEQLLMIPAILHVGWKQKDYNINLCPKLNFAWMVKPQNQRVREERREEEHNDCSLKP